MKENLWNDKLISYCRIGGDGLNLIKKAWRFLTTPEMILYIVFGVGTTLINIIVCGLCYNHLHWDILVANAVAWIVSVSFAFITNKLYVFKSKSFSAKVFWWELITFVGARLFTLIIDEAGMKYLVDVAFWNVYVAKVLVNVVVIAINYVLSKLIIFKKK